MNANLADDGASDAEVINLADRARDRAGEQREPRTLILQVSHVRSDAAVHRQFGIDDSQPLSALHEALTVGFGLDASAPWAFLADGLRLSGDDALHEHLEALGDELAYHWGLWQFRIRTADSWLRDGHTPTCLCIGGSGSFGADGFDIAAINAELTGEETTTAVLERTHAPVADVITRSRLYDFVPLLQALDLAGPTDLDDDTRERLAALPLEDDPASADAFWSIALALASLAEGEMATHIVETIMAALGWVEDDGSDLTGESIRQLCPASLAGLAALGAYGEQALNPVDRVGLYRELLRSRTAGE